MVKDWLSIQWLSALLTVDWITKCTYLSAKPWSSWLPPETFLGSVLLLSAPAINHRRLYYTIIPDLNLVVTVAIVLPRFGMLLWLGWNSGNASLIINATKSAYITNRSRSFEDMMVQEGELIFALILFTFLHSGLWAWRMFSLEYLWRYLSPKYYALDRRSNQTLTGSGTFTFFGRLFY